MKGKRCAMMTVSNQRRPDFRAATLLVSLLTTGWFFFSLAAPRAVEAATFTVTSTLDQTDVLPGDGICATVSNTCTLRAAIQEANAFPGPDTIKLGTGVYMLTLAGRSEDGCATGDLDITGDLTIAGTGTKNTFINGGNLDRVFHVTLPVSVTITKVTIQNGLAAEGTGGGFYNNGGSLTLEKSEVSNNFATREGGSYGGGIYSESGQLRIIGTTLSQNSAIAAYHSGAGCGGGIYINGGTSEITKSTLNRNSTGGYNGGSGAGIYSISATLSLLQTTVSNNFAFGTGYPGQGGGVFTAFSQVTVKGCTISYNSADGVSQRGLGGGIYTSSGDLTIAQTQISYNSCSGYSGGAGGGIYADGNITVQGGSKIMRNFATVDGGGLFINSGTPTIASDTKFTKNIPNDFTPP
jgi:CSLREA domain-containing protein